MPKKITIWDLQNQARALLPKARIRVCKRARQPGKEAAISAAKYINLMRCGNAWACPICGRIHGWCVAHNLGEAVKQWQDEGHACMVTYTTSHKLNDPLKDTLMRLKKAFRASKSGRRYQELKQAWGIAYSVVSWEVKYSDKNGFHPHIHELLFTTTPPGQGLFDDIEDDWLRRVPGLEKVAVNGTLADADIAEYIAKWGRPPKSKTVKPELPELAYEVALRHSKDLGGVTMEDMLARSITEPRFTRLWSEYAEATKGLSLIRASRGFEKQFGQLDAPPKLGGDLLAEYTFRPGTWQLVVGGGSDLRGDVIEAFKGGGGQAVDTLLLAKLAESQSKGA